MQVAFQNENVLEKNTSSSAKVVQNFGLGEAGLNFRNSQTNFKTHKVENETYGRYCKFKNQTSEERLCME